MNTSPLIALCAGEASGDLLGAHLIEAIRARCPQARFTGIGGPRMQAAGLESLFDQETLAVRGYVEVLKNLPAIWRIRKGLIAEMKRQQPDVFVGIYAQDFILGVSSSLKAAGITTLQYVIPTVCACPCTKSYSRQMKCCACSQWSRSYIGRPAGGRVLWDTRWRKPCPWKPTAPPHAVSWGYLKHSPYSPCCPAAA